MTETEYENINKIIQSAIDRTVHSNILKEEIIKTVKEAVHPAVKEIVNGKIDGLKKTVDEFHDVMNEYFAMDSEFKKRVEPIVIAYEDQQIIDKKVGAYGESAIRWSKIVTAIGVLFLAIKYAITKF